MVEGPDDDDDEENEGIDNGKQKQGDAFNDEIVSDEPLEGEELIEEPVTSGGDSDAWISEGNDDEDDEEEEEENSSETSADREENEQ